MFPNTSQDSKPIDSLLDCKESPEDIISTAATIKFANRDPSPDSFFAKFTFVIHERSLSDIRTSATIFVPVNAEWTNNGSVYIQRDMMVILILNVFLLL